MAEVGQRYELNEETVRFMAEYARNPVRIIELVGGIAVVRAHIDLSVGGIYSPLALLGVSARSDGTGGEMAVHTLYPLSGKGCENSRGCMGLTVSDGVINEVTGVMSPNFPSGVQPMLRSTHSHDIEPFGDYSQLAQEFEQRGHGFDPDTQPLLHEAFAQLVVRA